MSATTTPTAVAPLNREERLERANQLYREYHTRCFWHCPRELLITEDLIPLVVKGLRTHGGRRGFILSVQLQQRRTGSRASERETPGCL
ncbi:MAG: hypothetical protein HYS12_12025 [Planctomycetes bacterium]|nr:hypothetical protein [Planctomycetota bacterium]